MPEILMPQAGKSCKDGTITRWIPSPGSVVSKGDLLFEMETEEGKVLVESGMAGILSKILVPERHTVGVGTPVAVIEEKTSVRPESPAPQPPPPRLSMQDPTGIGRVIPILMPKAGQTMEEGTLVKWRVKPGDRIQKGQVIFEIETDKAVVEVEATDAGRLAKIVLPEGGVSPVMQPVAYLAENDADVEAFLAGGGVPLAPAGTAPPQTPPVPSATPSPPVSPPPLPPGEGGRVRASPAARKIASERGVDLSTLPPGSGPGGRILSTDVPTGPAPAALSPSPAGGPLRRPMTKMRRAIGSSLLYSKQNIPHFYASVTVHGDALFGFYREQKPAANCTLNDIVTLACARVVREMPAFRSRLEKDEIVESPEVHLGIAVGVEDGLVVPVLQNADRMTLPELACQARRIIENARAGKLEGIGKGCMTITNLGMFGVEQFGAIINPPEPAILAVGALREGIVVREGSIRPARVMTLTLSVDHRIIDGVLAARFLARLKEILEAPASLA